MIYMCRERHTSSFPQEDLLVHLDGKTWYVLNDHKKRGKNRKTKQEGNSWKSENITLFLLCCLINFLLVCDVAGGVGSI